jgi:hypothetical protein
MLEKAGERARRGVGLLRASSPASLLSWALWLATGVVVTALCLRFAMRALSVRDDVPFPAFLYGATADLVRPFYRYFPASPRFDARAFETASLAAAGVAVALAVAVYTAGLLAATWRER